MEVVSDPDKPADFDYEKEGAAFKKTFHILKRALSDRAFGRANPAKAGELVRGFGIYHFEAFTMGLQPFLDKADVDQPAGLQKVREVLMGIKLDPGFIELTTGGGKNSPGPLGQRIAFVEERLGASL